MPGGIAPIKRTHLSPRLRLCLYFITNNILPEASTEQNIKAEHLYLLYKCCQQGSSVRFNLPKLILKRIRQIITDEDNIIHLAFPIVITRILEEMLDDVLPFGEIISKEESPRHFVSEGNMSRLRLYRHPRTREWWTERKLLEQGIDGYKCVD